MIDPTVLRSAALLFGSSFVVVFALGLQQFNVERRSMLAAALTSPLIGIALYAQFKLLPGPTGLGDLAGYLTGGSAGIVASMWLHPRLLAWANRDSVPAPAASAEPDVAAEADTAAIDAVRLRLATQIADEATRAAIEAHCVADNLALRWWDTSRLLSSDADTEQFQVARAVQYLEMRAQLLHHPTQAHLVRFTPPKE